MPKRNIDYKPIAPEIAILAQEHGDNPEAVLEIFRDLQARQGGLTQEAIKDVARALHIPAERAYGVASFYSMLELAPNQGGTLRVCDGPVCWLHGSEKVRQAADELAEQHPEWKVERTSCLGLCDRAPAALVNDEQAGPLSDRLFADLLDGWRGEMPDYSQPRPGEKRVMMAKAGQIDPDSIESALEAGAYCGLGKALQWDAEEILSIVESSGLAGRGGAGFPVGRKWRFVAQAPRSPKYIICNADESEPLIFKDRVLIDNNPHQILEGMAVAGLATGANEAYIYIRGEYVSQAKRLESAIQQAEQKNWLGENIQGSGFSFRIHVHRGAGAYICGEETALIESLEGKRGEPRLRPPYPPTYGYRGMPTLVNNVESYAAVPAILCNGAEWYRGLSPTSTTPGTKMYMLLGHINRPGLFEAPFGLTLRQIIEEFGGGMRPGSQFHFALTGGAAGTIVSQEQLDIPIDYASAARGISLGAGAFLICDQSVSPVDFLREILHFFSVESCGKCTPCRVGTQRSYEILTHLSANGNNQPGDLQSLVELADVMRAASFCGLGQSVAIPVKSAIQNFSGEFEAASTRALTGKPESRD
jgi:NADH-quinone oxidoreductase subunit F